MEQQNGPMPVVLRFHLLLGPDMHYTILVDGWESDPMSEFKKNFEARAAVDFQILNAEFLYYFNGNIVNNESTMLTYSIEDSDTIEVVRLIL